MLNLKKVLAKTLTWLKKKPDYEIGTWTPHIYDYTIYKYALSPQPYLRIGDLYFMEIVVGSFPNTTFSSMMQIRNFPCNWITGGTLYMANVSGNFGDRTIQASDVGVYPRPNYTGTVNGGVFTALLIGHGIPAN